MAQGQVQKRHEPSDRQEPVEAPEPVVEHPESDALKAHSDELLDDIDALLETNAEEFVKGYIQKGGE